MSDFKELLEVIGSETRLHLLELLSIRARTIHELSEILNVTQQAIMKHLDILERYDMVKQVKVDIKSRVRSVYAVAKPLALGYVFKSGVLCLYIGSGELDTRADANVEALKEIAYRRNMLHIRRKIATNRLRALVEEDLAIQSEITSLAKKLRLSPLQTVALWCFLTMDSKKHMKEASEAFGFNLEDMIPHITRVRKADK